MLSISEEKKTNNYPKLMTDGEVIILCRAHEEGVVVYSENDDYSLGDWSNGWSMTHFRDYNGKLTLSN